MNIQSLIGLAKGQDQSQVFLSKNQPAIEINKDDNDAAVSDATEATIGEEFDTFLTLLTAQIRNQDPLAPLDSTQFVEQLATFSSVELQAKSNGLLEDIAQMLAQNLYSQQTAKIDGDAIS